MKEYLIVAWNRKPIIDLLQFISCWLGWWLLTSAISGCFGKSFETLYDGCYTWSGQARCSRLRRYLPTWSVLVQPSVAVKRQHGGVGLCSCLNNLWRSEKQILFVQFSSISQWVFFHIVFMNIYMYIYIYNYDICTVCSIWFRISLILNICYIQGYTGLSCFFHVSTIESM